MFRSINRAIARLNSWLSGAAVGSSVEAGGYGGGPTVNAAGVKTVLGEIASDTPGEQFPAEDADALSEK